jgi:general secretion pathway protein L
MASPLRSSPFKLRRDEAIVFLPPRALGERALASGNHFVLMRALHPGRGKRAEGEAIAPSVSRVSLETLPSLRAVYLIADARDVTVLQASLPKLPASRLARALPGLLEDQILQDSQQCSWALDPLPLPSGERRIGVIDAEWLETVIQAFERRRIKVLAVWPLQTVLRPSAGTSWLTGLPASLSLCMASGDALGWPPAATTPERLAQVEEAARLAESLAAPVARFQVGAPLWELDARPGSPLGWPERSSLDLMVARRSRRSRLLGQVDWRRWRPASVWAGLLVLLALLGLNLEWIRLANEERRLAAQLRADFVSVMGANTPMVDPALQLSRRIEALRVRAGRPDPDGFVALLARFGEALGSSSSDALLGLQYRDGQLSLRLRPALTQTPAARERLIDASRMQGLELSFGSDRDGLATVRPLR